MISRIDKDHSRFREIVRGKIRQNLRKYISRGDLMSRKGKDTVTIPMPQIDIPRFTLGGNQKSGVGQGEGATRNFLTRQVAKLPFVFNVKIQAPFRQLISSAKGFYDPTLVIEQNLPTLLRVQQQVDAAKPGAEPPVQPPESEPVP